MSDPIRVLIVDDEAFVRDSLSEVLRAEGMAPQAAGGGRAAIEALERQRPDVIVTDLRMPSGDGMELLAEARAASSEIPIIVITGVGTVGEAVQAMKAGAFDFLQKPVDPEELALLVRRAAEHRRLVSEVASLRTEVQGLQARRRLVGSSPALQRVRAAIAQVAPTEATVLITGESGTGKELVAEEIHRASSRAGRSLLRVNLAAIPAELSESELFGHRKGAFTGAAGDRAGRFAEAERGTLVLDEIGALPAQGQAKLLRVLESGEYQVVGESRTRLADVRVVAITNEDLSGQVRTGAFRSDLFWRLNVFPIELPPLRAHAEDVGEIAEHLLDVARRAVLRTSGNGAGPLDPEALEVLRSYDWPGNVRELRNVLERALILAGDEPIDAPLVAGILESPTRRPLQSGGPEYHLRTNLDGLERQLVLRAIAHTRGRRREAAQLLGIDPRNLGYYLRKHKISEDELREAQQH